MPQTTIPDDFGVFALRLDSGSSTPTAMQAASAMGFRIAALSSDADNEAPVRLGRVRRRVWCRRDHGTTEARRSEADHVGRAERGGHAALPRRPVCRRRAARARAVHYLGLRLPEASSYMLSYIHLQTAAALTDSYTPRTILRAPVCRRRPTLST